MTEDGPATLQVEDLHAEVEGKQILRGIDLIVRQGETHALMGPNGSGKSTLSNVIMGRPGYVVTGGRVVFKGEDITGLTPDQRAKRGLFLAMQYPTEVPGGLGGELHAHGLPIREERAGERPGLPQAHEIADGEAPHRRRDGEPLREPGILRWGEEAERDPAAGGAGTADRHPGRDRLGAGHRLAQARRRGRQRAGRTRTGRPAHHSLPAHAQLHHARSRPRDDARTYREDRRRGARARAGRQGLRGDPQGVGSGGRRRGRGRQGPR